MRRLAIVTGCAGLALAGTSLAQSAEQVAWAAIVERGDWELTAVSHDGATVALVKGRKQTSPSTVRAWVRFELKTAMPSGAMTVVGLQEFDCTDDRMRSLQTNKYAENNMRGTMLGSDGVGEWSFVIPGSISESIHEKVCG